MPEKANFVRIISSILIFLAVFGVTLFAFSQRAREEVGGDPSWALVMTADAKVPPAVRRKVAGLLAEQPLNQAALNLLFATEARGRMEPGRRAAFVDTLGALGWRDTATQQNLIVEAARRKDPQAALLHIDALLRRGKMTDQIMPLLAQMETYPDALDLLAVQLGKKPNWRMDYFGFTAPLQNPVILDGRVQLLNRMLSKGQPISHSELMPSLKMIMLAGRRADAARIGMSANHMKQDNIGLYDPDFSRYLALSSEDRNSPLPFEWETVSRPGISAQIVPRSGGGMLQLRWNGLGAPVLARTMALTKVGDDMRLEVAVDRADALAQLEMLGFALNCPGKVAAFTEMRRDKMRKLAIYTVESGIPCDYPDLIVQGRPQTRDLATETDIASIRLVRQ